MSLLLSASVRLEVQHYKNKRRKSPAHTHKATKHTGSPFAAFPNIDKVHIFTKVFKAQSACVVVFCFCCVFSHPKADAPPIGLLLGLDFPGHGVLE